MPSGPDAGAKPVATHDALVNGRWYPAVLVGDATAKRLTLRVFVRARDAVIDDKRGVLLTVRRWKVRARPTEQAG